MHAYFSIPKGSFLRWRAAANTKSDCKEPRSSLEVLVSCLYILLLRILPVVSVFLLLMASSAGWAVFFGWRREESEAAKEAGGGGTNHIHSFHQHLIVVF